MEKSTFETFRRLALEHTGLVLRPGKEYLLECRLTPIVEAQGLESLSSLATTLEGRGGRELLEEVLDALTTHETSFFRDRLQFDALRDHVLPELISMRRDVRALRIWCGACASGQEPYSIAILLAEHFRQLDSWHVRILGTDVSEPMVRRASSGRFSDLEIARGLDATLRDRYFQRDGPDWVIDPELRRRVTFRQQNLMIPLDVPPALDIVLIRNVLIYFDDATKAEVLDRVRERMADDGYLFLGAGEFPRGVAFESVHSRDTHYCRSSDRAT